MRYLNAFNLDAIVAAGHNTKFDKILTLLSLSCNDQFMHSSKFARSISVHPFV